MNLKILEKEVQNYIHQRSEEKIDIAKLILSGSPFEGISSKELAQQISGRIKAKSKLPSWYNTLFIYYPSTLNLEQTSSELTAKYKSELISGDLLVDLTGGFGIDDYYFSKKINTIIHCELNAALSKITEHNLEILKVSNIKNEIGDGFEIMQNYDSIDWLYIDPSRRNEQNKKVFFLEDCTPNIPEKLDILFNKTDQILIKTSPLLDISAGIQSLKYIQEIHVVAIQNEVKELLWILKKNSNEKISIMTINIKQKKDDTFSFYLDDESTSESNFSLPKKYLYEPNSAIMKSGGFISVGVCFGINKLHKNTHLYTSDTLFNFPGRTFEILEILPYSKKVIGTKKITKANITTRNFTSSVSEIREKFKLKDGGDVYLFFTTDLRNRKIVIHCKKKMHL